MSCWVYLTLMNLNKNEQHPCGVVSCRLSDTVTFYCLSCSNCNNFVKLLSPAFSLMKCSPKYWSSCFNQKQIRKDKRQRISFPWCDFAELLLPYLGCYRSLMPSSLAPPASLPYRFYLANISSDQNPPSVF